MMAKEKERNNYLDEVKLRRMDDFINSVIKSDFSAVSKLIEEDPDLVNSVSLKNGFTGLHYAAMMANERMIELLIRARSPALVEDSLGRIPLQLLVGVADDEVVALLEHYTFPENSLDYDPFEETGPLPLRRDPKPS